MNLFAFSTSTPLGDTKYNNRHEKRNFNRVQEIMDSCPSGERALDIGCNSGYFSKGLLSNGLAQYVDAIEFNATVVPEDLKKDERFSLFEGDATNFSFEYEYDTVVYGAVHHHIFAHHGYAGAMAFWNKLVEHTKSTIFMESGQLAEGSRWYWQRALREYYSTDEQYFGDLVYAIGPRLKSIKVIGTHWIHGVRRWLVKIELHPKSKGNTNNLPIVSNIQKQQSLYRTIGSNNQSLLPEGVKNNQQHHEGVTFTVGSINENKKVFCKKYIAKEMQNFEMLIAQQINDDRFIVPIGISNDNGLVFPFISAKKLSEIDLDVVKDKKAFKQNIMSLYQFAKNKDITIDFSGTRIIKLIDVIDMHQSNIFIDEDTQRLYVFDLEFYSMANFTRNDMHLNKVLYALDFEKLSATFSLTSAAFNRLVFLLKMALTKPEKRILSRIENFFSWGYIKLREKADQLISVFFSKYWQ